MVTCEHGLGLDQLRRKGRPERCQGEADLRQRPVLDGDAVLVRDALDQPLVLLVLSMGGFTQ